MGLLWTQKLVKANYSQKYSVKECSTMNKIAIVFWSGTGNTEAMAGFIAEGVRAAGGEAELLGPGEFSASQFFAYSA